MSNLFCWLACGTKNDDDISEPGAGWDSVCLPTTSDLPLNGMPELDISCAYEDTRSMRVDQVSSEDILQEGAATALVVLISVRSSHNLMHIRIGCKRWTLASSGTTNVRCPRPTRRGKPGSVPDRL